MAPANGTQHVVILIVELLKLVQVAATQPTCAAADAAGAAGPARGEESRDEARAEALEEGQVGVDDGELGLEDGPQEAHGERPGGVCKADVDEGLESDDGDGGDAGCLMSPGVSVDDCVAAVSNDRKKEKRSMRRKTPETRKESKTYKIPRQKIPSNPIFDAVGILSFHTNGIGSNSTMKSVTIFDTPAPT